jgi:hypothetical protein
LGTFEAGAEVEETEAVEPIDPLRARVAELLREGNRLEAIKAVRTAILDPVSAKRYTDAVANGASLPEELTALIPQPQRARAGHITLTGPNPEPRP